MDRSRVERIELAPGYSISRIIKGGWHLAGGHGIIDPDQAVRDMAGFVEAGITTFDCADIYTGVEELIGRFRVQASAAMTTLSHRAYIVVIRFISFIMQSTKRSF